MVEGDDRPKVRGGVREYRFVVGVVGVVRSTDVVVGVGGGSNAFVDFDRSPVITSCAIIRSAKPCVKYTQAAFHIYSFAQIV